MRRKLYSFIHFCVVFCARYKLSALTPIFDYINYEKLAVSLLIAWLLVSVHIMSHFSRSSKSSLDVGIIKDAFCFQFITLNLYIKETKLVYKKIEVVYFLDVQLQFEECLLMLCLQSVTNFWGPIANRRDFLKVKETISILFLLLFIY